MSIESVLIYTCDRCWKTAQPEFKGEVPEGWISRGAQDFCEDCAEKVSK